MNVLFVCLGNICRSPIAEGILKQLFKSKGLGGLVESAGFESFHINDAPDPRAVSVSAGHGIDISQKEHACSVSMILIVLTEFMSWTCTI